MPHDRNGILIKKGDKVLIPAIVLSVQESSDYCNVTVEPIEPMPPENTKFQITLNTKQTQFDSAGIR